MVLNQIPNIKVVVVGRKQNSWEHKVGDYVKSIDDQIAQLIPKVISMGWVNDMERNSLFKLADICVMPSEMEYFPYSILEPMASKVPIISSALPCVEEMLEKDLECLFFTPLQEKELAEQLIKLARDPKLRNSLADASFEKVVQMYSWKGIANQYIKYYCDILSNQLIVLNHAEILFN
jgi:glycosyltransferase involved in cell wall biosynthesis